MRFVPLVVTFGVCSFVWVLASVAAAEEKDGDPPPPPSTVPAPLPNPVPPPAVSVPTASQPAQPAVIVLPPAPELPTRPPAGRHVFLIPGYLLTFTPAVASDEYTNSKGGTSYKNIATGHGVELSLNVYEPRTMWYYGALIQVQRFISDRGNHSRYMVGVQGGYMLWGLEAGFSHRTADDTRQDTNFVHFGFDLSLVFINFVGQLGIPFTIGGSERETYKLEGSFGLSIKIPVLIQ